MADVDFDFNVFVCRSTSGQLSRFFLHLVRSLSIRIECFKRYEEFIIQTYLYLCGCGRICGNPRISAVISRLHVWGSPIVQLAITCYNMSVQLCAVHARRSLNITVCVISALRCSRTSFQAVNDAVLRINSYNKFIQCMCLWTSSIVHRA